MKSFVKISPDGRFSLDGKRWFCNSTIYYGRFPGACGTDWFLDLPLATSGARDVDMTQGAAVWLRNTWGYFWKQMQASPCRPGRGLAPTKASGATAGTGWRWRSSDRS